MVKQRPDLFYAYVGTGQVSNLAKSLQVGYADTLRKARAANDARAIKELEDIGPPPYDIPDKLSVLFNWLGAYQAESDRLAMSSLGSLMFGAPNYSLRDIYYRTKGLSGFGSAATWRFLNAMQSTDLSRLGPNFQVPIYFFQGAEDEITVPSLAKEYFERIDAPYKRVVISRCGVCPAHFCES
jgi:pimeloyl-ACP methyl ester carboxylesterase